MSKFCLSKLKLKKSCTFFCLKHIWSTERVGNNSVIISIKLVHLYLDVLKLDYAYLKKIELEAEKLLNQNFALLSI